MKTYQITEAQIEQAHQAACSEWKKTIEEWFPEVFEDKTVSGWYIHKNERHKAWLCFFDKENPKKSYGFNSVGEFRKQMDMSSGYIYEHCQPAMPSEVKAALVAEAKKRYKNGDIIGTHINNLANPVGDSFRIEYDRGENPLVFDNNGAILFRHGLWAEIIEKAPTELTKEQIEEKLGYKIKIV